LTPLTKWVILYLIIGIELKKRFPNDYPTAELWATRVSVKVCQLETKSFFLTVSLDYERILRAGFLS
jgi:hypothetical protein